MRWRVDVGLVALSALIGLFFLADSPIEYPIADVVLWVVAAAALVVGRRRWTVPIAVGLIPLMVVSTLSMGPAVVAVGVVARYRRWPTTLAVLGTHLGLVLGAFAVVASGDPEFVIACVAVIALDAALVATGRLVRSQRELVESWKERAREAEVGQRLRIEEARHAERERIAGLIRVIHLALETKYVLGTHAGCAPMMERVRSGARLQRSKKAWVASTRASTLPNSSQWVTSRR